MQFFLGRWCNLYNGKRCWVSTKLVDWLILCTLKSVWVDLFVLRFNIKWPTALINKVLSKLSGLLEFSKLLEDSIWASAPLHNRRSRSDWSMFLEDLDFEWILDQSSLDFLMIDMDQSNLDFLIIDMDQSNKTILEDFGFWIDLRINPVWVSWWLIWIIQ